jgi:hypothetical protein
MKKFALPEDIQAMLAEADKRNGFPSGTMAAIMQQEVGGQAGDYLADPGRYHYGLNESGRRIAPHTGKISTAFGPFGILESTAAKPGYGVAPLRDKSLPEQIRFASEYLAGRIKDAGSFEAGLAGYGEGAKYANSVAGRISGTPKAAPMAAPVASAPQLVRDLPSARYGAQEPTEFGFQPTPEALAALKVQIPDAPKTVDEPPVYRKPTEKPSSWQDFVQSMPMAEGPAVDFSRWMQPPKTVPTPGNSFNPGGFRPFGFWTGRA